MFGYISLVFRTSTTLPYSGSGITLNLMAHSIRCDLSIARHEFKMGKICELFRPKNYRLASISIICFVERSKKGMWDKNRTSELATVD